MDMVERVEAAIREAIFRQFGTMHTGGTYDAARAAIAAMREPTPEMIDGFGIHKARMTRNWHAMIDASL